jgi:glycosyltransferase involved in cell wall biosynthesis
MGGAPLSLLYLIEQLDRARYEPEVLFLGNPSGEVDAYARRGIPFRVRSDITSYPHAENARLTLRSLRPWEVVTRPLQILPSANRMREELMARPVDLVHINTSVLLPVGIGASRAGVPVVWHVREPLYRGAFGLRRALVRGCIDRCSSAVIAISKADAARLIQGPKVHVVYNFVNFEVFNRDIDSTRIRESLGIDSRARIVLMLGGRVESKGADVLVRAASLSMKRDPTLVFLIAGVPLGGQSPSWIKRTARHAIESIGAVPNMGRRVRSLILEHRLEKVVRFLGMRSDVPWLLAAADVLVWPATVPHFARPVIEAGAMARPVIASDFAASRETVVDGETGILVAPRDPGALAEAIARVFSDAQAARRMGEAGYRLARERYDARRGAESIMAIYDQVLAR